MQLSTLFGHLKNTVSHAFGLSAAPPAAIGKPDIAHADETPEPLDPQALRDLQNDLYADLEADMGDTPVDQWFLDQNKSSVIDPDRIHRGSWEPVLVNHGTWEPITNEPRARVVIGQSEQGYHFAIEREAEPGGPDAPAASLSWSQAEADLNIAWHDGKEVLDGIVYQEEIGPDYDEPEVIDSSKDIPGEPGYGTGGECYRNEAGQLHRDPAEGPARVVIVDRGEVDLEDWKRTAYYVVNGELQAINKASHVSDCEGSVSRDEWLNAEGQRHRDDGPAYSYSAYHRIPEETHLDDSYEEFWINGVKTAHLDRTYSDILQSKSLAERQSIGVDVDGPDAADGDLEIVTFKEGDWQTKDGMSVKIDQGASVEGYHAAVHLQWSGESVQGPWSPAFGTVQEMRAAAEVEAERFLSVEPAQRGELSDEFHRAMMDAGGWDNPVYEQQERENDAREAHQQRRESLDFGL